MRAVPRLSLAAIGVCGALAAAAPVHNAALGADEDADRAQRWQALSHAVFGARALQDGNAMLALQAPKRAEDAALVPITITTTHGADIKGLYLLVDDNPAPMAAHFSFGAGGRSRGDPAAHSASINTPTCMPWPKDGTASFMKWRNS